MRACGWLTLLLLAAGWAACHWPSQAAEPALSQLGVWRRTADGWERRSGWGAQAAAFRPPLHPATAMMFASLVSYAGLLVFAPAMPANRGSAAPPPWHVERRRAPREAAAVPATP